MLRVALPLPARPCIDVAAQKHEQFYPINQPTRAALTDPSTSANLKRLTMFSYCDRQAWQIRSFVHRQYAAPYVSPMRDFHVKCEVTCGLHELTQTKDRLDRYWMDWPIDCLGLGLSSS